MSFATSEPRWNRRSGTTAGVTTTRNRGSRAPPTGCTCNAATTCGSASSSTSSRPGRPPRPTRPTAMISSTWCPAARFPAEELLEKLDALDRALDRPAGAQDAGPERPRRESRAVRADAGGAEHASFLHVGAARARLEHDPDRQFPGRPLRQVLRATSTRRSTAA